MTTPLPGAGRTHRVGPVRHGVGGYQPCRRNVNLTDRNLSLSAHSVPLLLGHCGTVPAVLGQAHTPRRRLLPLAAIAVVVLVAPAVGAAIPSHGTASLRSQNAALAAKSRAAVLDLYSLENRLATAQTRLASLERETTTLRAERASLRRQASIARRGVRISQAQLANRLRILYEQGNVEPLEIVFGSRSLDEALASIDSLSRMSGQAEDVLKELKAARTRIARNAAQLASREARLRAATAAAEATAASLAQARSARTAYIASLSSQRRLNERQIARLVAAARAAQARTAQLASAPAVVPAAVAPTPAGATTLTVSATGYSLGGRTATGLPVGLGVVAVDPSVIPLGTHMTVPGYGEAVAADVGGGVVGASIDLWFPSVAQANAWGRRTVTIVLH